MQGEECQLASGMVSNIVALGKLVNRDAGNTWTVMIMQSVKPTCPLPYAQPDMDMYQVCQAYGSPIPWPKEFVILPGQVIT